MREIPLAARRLAEDMNTYAPLRPGDRRIESDLCVLFCSETPGPHGTVVQRLRLADTDIPTAVAEIRGKLRDLGRTVATWEVGPSATPADLGDRLLALGMEAHDAPISSVVSGMVCDELALDDAPAPGLTVERVATLPDFRAAQSLYFQSFGVEEDADFADATAKDFARLLSTPSWLRYVARDETGRIVAAADATLTPAGVLLSGGATLPEARGRGAYRALVRARWQDAVGSGTPWLITQAGAMSRPILLRLGFREVVQIRVFVDKLA